MENFRCRRVLRRKVLFSGTGFLHLLEGRHIMYGVIEHLSQKKKPLAEFYLN